MADMDTLIVTFQTQLSDVMEAVVKTAMYEVTRLVEDGLLEELKARNQEVETLRIQLHWAEMKLSDQEAKEVRTVKCVDSNKDAVEKTKESHNDILRGGQTENDNDSVESLTKSSRHEIKPGPEQAPDNPAASFSLVRKPQAKADDHKKQVEDVKEEAVVPLSCSSVNIESWRVPLGEAGSDHHNASAMTDIQQKLCQENNKELLRHVIQQDSQILATYVFPEEQKNSGNATHVAHINPVTSAWPQMDHSSENGCESKSSQNCTGDQSQSVNAQDTSRSPKQRSHNSNVFGVSIKQEVITDPEPVEDGTNTEKKEMPKSVQRMFSCSVKQHRGRTEIPKQNSISYKASLQDVVKQQSKVSTGHRLNAAHQQLQRPIKKPPNLLSNSSPTAINVAHSQTVSMNLAHRHPTTSKTAFPSPMSLQRAHLGDKQALNRTGAPWITIKSQQSSNSLHTSPLSHIDSHLHTGSRHILRCGQCGKCFPHPSNLKAHLQTHTGERPFCCSLCSRSFTKLSNLKAHRRVHTGERPYSCLSCGKRFTQKCNLKRHQRIHIDV